MGLQLEVYSRESPSVKLDVLPNATQSKFLEEREGVGAGSFVIHNDDERVKDAIILQDRNIVKARLDGKIQSAFIIQKKDPAYIKPGEVSDELTTVSGKGLKDWFRDAALKADFGVFSNFFTTRAFNFASNHKRTGTTDTWYAAAKWQKPVQVHKYGAQSANPWRYRPANWPDAPDSYWLWSSKSATPGLGFNYFRTDMMVKAANTGKYSLFVAADDLYEVYVDGQLAYAANPGSDNWNQVNRVDFDIENEGTHVIGIKVQNLAGRAGMIATVFKNGDSSKKTKAKIVVPSKSANWLVCAYPETPPNWTLGEIWDLLLEEAAARNVWFAQFVSAGYTAEADSLGNPWSRELEWTFNIGESYLSIMEKMQELAADIWIDPDTYMLHIAQHRGVDRTVEAGVDEIMMFRKGHDLISADQKTEWDVKNSLIVNNNGKRLVVDDSKSIQKYGRVEDVLDLQADSSLAKLIASKVVKDASIPTQGASYEVIPREGSIPFVDYNIGDWVLAPGGRGPRTRRRIESIGFAATGNAGKIEYQIEFDSVFQTRQSRLERWIKNTLSGSLGGKISSSSAISNQYRNMMSGLGGAGFEVPPVPPVVQSIAPASGYYSTAGLPQASVRMMWSPAVDEETEEVIESDIANYEVWGLNLSTGLDSPAPMMFARTSDTATEISQLEPDTTYEFQVKSIRTNGTESEWSESVRVTTGFPETKPVIPSVPRLYTRLGIVTVEWDGLLSDGSPVDASFDSVQPFVATESGGPYRLEGPAIRVAGGTSPIGDWPVGTVCYVVLAVRKKDGSLGDYSEEAAILVQGVTIPDVERDLMGLIEEAQTSADGKNRIWYRPTTQPPEGPFATGDTWFVTDLGNQMREWTGTEWSDKPFGTDAIANLAITNAKIGNLDAGKITTGYLSAARLQAKTIGVDKLIVANMWNLIWDGNYSTWDTTAWVNAPNGGPGSAWDTTFVRPGTPVSQKLKEFPSGTAIMTLYSAMRAGVNIATNANTDRLIYTGDRVGKKLVAYAYYYADMAPPTGMTSMSTQIYFYDSAGTIILNAIGGRVLRADVKVGEWMRIGGTQVEVPVNAQYAIIRPTIYYLNSTTSVNGVTYYLGGEEMYWADAGELIVDGSITAGMIQARAITTDKLDVGAVKADILDADAVNGKTIRGVTVIGGTLELQGLGSGTIDMYGAGASSVPAGRSFVNISTGGATLFQSGSSPYAVTMQQPNMYSTTSLNAKWTPTLPFNGLAKFKITANVTVVGSKIFKVVLQAGTGLQATQTLGGIGGTFDLVVSTEQDRLDAPIMIGMQNSWFDSGNTPNNDRITINSIRLEATAVDNSKISIERIGANPVINVYDSVGANVGTLGTLGLAIRDIPGDRATQYSSSGLTFMNVSGTAREGGVYLSPTTGILRIDASKVEIEGYTSTTFINMPKFPADVNSAGVPGTPNSSFTLLSSTYTVRAGWVNINFNMSSGSIPNNTSVNVWTNIPASLRPNGNKFGAAYFSGGVIGTIWIRSDGTIAASQNSGSTVTGVQGTITYPLVL